MMRATKTAIPLIAAALLLTALCVGVVGCGGEAVDSHEGHDDDDHAAEAEEVDPHAGHDHGDEAEEAEEADGHDDQDDDDHADEAEEVDPHAGHDHGDEPEAEGLTLSKRNLTDAGVKLATAGPGEIEVHSRFLGEVQMNQERTAHVVPPVAGTVRDVRVRVGDEVKAGQVLAVLASRELAEARAEYLGARGRRELAQIDHDREKELWEREILAEQDYLDAKQVLLEADIDLQAAEQTLHAIGTNDHELDLLQESHEAGAMTRLELRSPISGTVTTLHMVLGEMVMEDSDVLVVADLSTVWVELDIPQAELHALRKGQTVHISASGIAVPDAVGVLSFISPVVDEETRTILARIELPNESGEWRPGLFVEASVASDHIDAGVVVPKDAVQLLEGEQVVFVPDGDAFMPALVVPGRSTATHVEIVTGLELGQRYVAEGAFALKSEMITSGMDSHAGHGH